MLSVHPHPDTDIDARRAESCSGRGFSLIELLVAISIIAVLLGILIPTLPRVMDNARRTACQANLNGHWQACTMHLHDNSDRFPVAKYMPDPWLSGDTNPSLNEALSLYYEGSETSRGWKCPGDSQIFGYEEENEEGEVITGTSSYTYTASLSGQTIDETFFVRFLGFRPEQVPVLRDFDGGTFETEGGAQVTADFFHRDRNALFADGHIGGFEGGSDG